MANIDNALYSRLSGYAGLSALVSTRIYPERMPQNPTFPAVVYEMLSGVRQPAMGSDTGMVFGRYQVSAWAQTYDAARNVAEQVRAALQRFQGTSASVTIDDILVLDERAIHEERTELFQRLLDLRVYWRE